MVSRFVPYGYSESSCTHEWVLDICDARNMRGRCSKRCSKYDFSLPWQIKVQNGFLEANIAAKFSSLVDEVRCVSAPKTLLFTWTSNSSFSRSCLIHKYERLHYSVLYFRMVCFLMIIDYNSLLLLESSPPEIIFP